MAKPSWLFWVIAVLAVLWQGYGIFDFWMTSSGNEEYLKEFPSEMIVWIKGFPLWRNVIWAVSVIAGFLGAIALIFRKRIASTLMLAGWVLLLAGFIGHDILLANGIEMYGTAGLIASAIIIIITGFFWWWANRSARRGVIA